MTDKKTAKFCVVYDGDSHKNHEIDMETLGDSLKALSNVLKETNRIINGYDSQIEILVDAEFIKGSFGLEIELLQYASDFDILTPLGFFTSGSIIASAISIIKNLKKTDNITIIQKTDDIDAEIIVNGKTIVCSKDVARIVSNKAIRNNLQKVIRNPLSNNGTSSFIVKKDKNSVENELIINKIESKSFTKLSFDTHTEIEKISGNVKFIAANIEKKDGWKIEFNGKIITTYMKDEFFLERLKNMTEPHVFGKEFSVSLEKVSKTQFGSPTIVKLFITRVNSEID